MTFLGLSKAIQNYVRRSWVYMAPKFLSGSMKTWINLHLKKERKQRIKGLSKKEHQVFTFGVLSIHIQCSENKTVLRVFSDVTYISYQFTYENIGNLQWRERDVQAPVVMDGKALLCCARTAAEVQTCSQAEVQGSLPLPPPSLDMQSPPVSGLQKQQNVWKGRLCVWQLCLILISGGKSASTPHGHWLLEGCSHKQNAGGHVIFSLPFLPSSQQAKCNAWNSRDVSWKNVLECKGDVWKCIIYTNMNQQFLLICPRCFRYVVKY